MDFQEMDEDELPEANVEELINELSESDNCTIEENQSIVPPSVDTAAEQPTHNAENVVFPKTEPPSATSSKSKHISVISETKTKGIQEFVRILRPHLPRKSKSKAYKLLQNIAKGIVVESSFQRRIHKKKTKKRPMRRPRARQIKAKSLSVARRNARSMYGSSDSCRSGASCPRCGYSCCRITRC